MKIDLMVVKSNLIYIKLRIIYVKSGFIQMKKPLQAVIRRFRVFILHLIDMKTHETIVLG